jgi:N-acetylmuramoyl-L-alanine amidase
VSFQAGLEGQKRPVLFDYNNVLYLASPYSEGGGLFFPAPFVSAIEEMLQAAVQADLSSYRIAAIIIDPGHGGKDSGAQGAYKVGGKQVKVLEKDITLAAGKALHKRLAAAYPEKRILLTRQGDTFPSLAERSAFANAVRLKENEAIVYISIHANASFNKNARGYEVWYLSPDVRRSLLTSNVKAAAAPQLRQLQNTMLEEEFTKESILIAQSIMKAFGTALGSLAPSRGIKAAEWFVVKHSRMPAVLVELGFVSNAEDVAIMTGSAGLQKLTNALYNGISEFIVKFEQSGGFIASHP